MSNNQHDEEQLHACLTALNNLQDVINNLKVGISYVLGKGFNAALLVRMEALQTHLLNHDAAIALLRHQLSGQVKDANAGGDQAHMARQDPAEDVSAISEAIEKLKAQLLGYTSALIRNGR
jgi:hypothetical protein